MAVVVHTMYEKTSGKGAKHCRASSASSVGALPYVFVRLFSHSGTSRHGRQHFREAYTPIKTDRYTHLNAFAFLCIVPSQSVRSPPGSRGLLELGAGVFEDIFRDLVLDRVRIARAVHLLINPPKTRKQNVQS